MKILKVSKQKQPTTKDSQICKIENSFNLQNLLPAQVSPKKSNQAYIFIPLTSQDGKISWINYQMEIKKVFTIDASSGIPISHSKHSDKRIPKIICHVTFEHLVCILRKWANTPGKKYIESLTKERILNHFYFKNDKYQDPYVDMESFQKIKCFSNPCELVYIIDCLRNDGIISFSGGQHKNTVNHFCKSSGESYDAGGLGTILCQTKETERSREKRTVGFQETRSERREHYGYIKEHDEE